MGAIKKTSPKATDNNRYAGSFVKRNRRRIIVGREDKSALNSKALIDALMRVSKKYPEATEKYNINYFINSAAEYTD